MLVVFNEQEAAEMQLYQSKGDSDGEQLFEKWGGTDHIEPRGPGLSL